MPEKSKHFDIKSTENLFLHSSKEEIDLKIPLPSAEKKINEAISRLLEYCEVEVGESFSILGIEQEYFLINRQLALRRPDLLFTGRTVYGTNFSEKTGNQGVSSIKSSVSAYISDCEEQAACLAVPMKTERHESFLSKYIAVSSFEKSLVAFQHNKLLKEILHQTAARYDLAVLFHEQPFAGISGTSQFMYWSISTDAGCNLLDPKESRLVFFTLLTAVVRAVHKHGPLLLASLSSADNDHRISEKKGAFFSAYLGEQLEKIVDDFVHERLEEKNWPQKIFSSDKNQKAFLNFDEDKFAFSILGSVSGFAFTLAILNATIAESLQLILDEIEGGMKNPQSLEQKCKSVFPVLRKILKEAHPMNFRREGYLEEEKKEMQIPKSYHAYEAFLNKSAVQAFDGILSEKKLQSLYEQLTEQYAKTVRMEAAVMIDLFRTQILPASLSFQEIWARSLHAASEVGIPSQPRLLDGLSTFSELMNQAIAAMEAIERVVRQAEEWDGTQKQKYFVNWWFRKWKKPAR